MRKCPCASGGEAVMSEVTIKDIARLCGVGISTVSRAINDHPDINPATKKQIQEMIEQYGYIPNNSARNLKRTESNAVAILVKGITNPLFSSMIRVLDEKLKRFKFDMLVQHINYDEEKCISNICNYHTDQMGLTSHQALGHNVWLKLMFPGTCQHSFPDLRIYCFITIQYTGYGRL